MGKEIERKYLVISKKYKEIGKPTLYRQGYLNTDENRIVRIRVAGTLAFITIKGLSVGPSRPEYEYEIPIEDANEMLQNLCEKPLIEKYRYKIPYKDLTLEIDEFLGENEGLVIAELEIPDENLEFQLPDWIGKEVTGESKYYNASLIKKPYCNWEKNESK